MACPYFYPTARFDDGPWAIPPRLPLGDPYSGECRANSEAYQPDETCVREICNLGYGRDRCPRFPSSAQSDAVRFNVSEDARGLIHIQYILEKDCWPREHGTLDYSVASGAFAAGPEDQVIQRQATVFAESYLRRRG